MLLSTIDIKESLTDTPIFRAQLSEYDNELINLDSHLKALIRCIKESNELSQMYSKKMETFAQLLDTSPAFLSNKSSRSDDIIGIGRRKSLDILESVQKRMSSGLREIERSRNMLQMHVNDVFLGPIETLVRDEIPRIRDNKRRFEKLSDEHEGTLNRYMNKKENDVALDECYQDFLRSRETFRDASFSHAKELKDFQMTTQIEITENTLAFMYALQTFYHQGYEIFKDAEPSMKETSDQVQQMRESLRKDREETSNLRNLLMQNEDGLDQESSLPQVLFSSCQAGYLYLKSDQRIFETWSRFYFKIEDDALLYFSRDKSDEPVGKIDLKLCSAKAASSTDRRFCFLLVSNSRNYLLQAESESKVKLWIATLHRAIENALKFNRSELRSPALGKARLGPPPSDANHLDQMRSLSGNDCCADCKADSPTWACINLGILVCIECSGIHRSLGVHISKIRSLTLDNWEPTLVEIMMALGNRKVNRIMEHQLLHASDVDVVLSKSNTKTITANSSREDKSSWIVAKYVTKAFCEDPPAIEDTNKYLLNSLRTNDFPMSLKWIILGGDVGFQYEGTTLFHEATEAGDLKRLEFLLMWSPNLVELTDSKGRNALHVAATASNPRLVWFLLQKGSNWEDRDFEGKLPLERAMDVPDVPVVMAFRYFVFLKQSNPKLTQESQFGFDQAIELFGLPSK